MPSQKHEGLARKAITFWGTRATSGKWGARREINFGPGYVADACAICSFQHRFAQRYKIPGADIPWTPLARQNIVDSKTIRRLWQFYSQLIELVLVAEVKVSRNDFLKTFIRSGNEHDNRMYPVGNLHWVVTPKGLVSPEEVPAFWGLLEESGSGLKEIKKPEYNRIEVIDVYRVAYQMLRPGWRANGSDDFMKGVEDGPEAD